MATYSIHNEYKLHGVICQLRGEGFRAFSELWEGKNVLCTDASLSIIAVCSGDGLWASRLFSGLPCESCVIV